MNNLTKNDIGWKKLFDKYQILDKINKSGKFLINSSEINEFREARLMTKFDHKKNLPTLFQKNNLSILPITRGRYLIASIEVYKLLDTKHNTPIEYLQLPEHIQSIDDENITSEATAINCAYVSGIFAHFLEEDELLPTVSGRMSSNKFNFIINNLNGKKETIFVENSQVEVDGGYEGVNSLSLIEAKNSLSSDFLIRQLYYPFRLWTNKIDKTVRSIFLVYTNGIFYLYEFKFEKYESYNSIILIKKKRYSLEKTNISLDDIQNILLSTKIKNEPKIPFPQADSFERIINLCELLNVHSKLSHEEITTTYDFDKRQTDYYTNAGRYLGLIKKHNDDGIIYSLTDEGKLILKKKTTKRQLSFVRLILRHKVFSKVLEAYLTKAEPPQKKEVIAIMKEAGLYNVKSDSTLKRRESTISSWINWILNLQY